MPSFRDMITRYCRARHMRVLFAVVAMLIVHCCYCQYININKDEVRAAISRATTDTARARLYGVLGWELRHSDQPEALRLADEMIRIATRGKVYLRLAEAYRIKGFVRVVNQDLQGCLDMYALGIENAKKAGSHYYLASFSLLTGGMYQDKGDYDMAIPYYLEGLREAEESNDPEMIAYAASTTAEVYADAGRGISFTLPFYKKALAQLDRTQNWQFAGMTWSSMAKDYLAAGQTTEAEKAVTRSIAFLLRKPERGYVYATVTTDIGEVLTGLARYAEAEPYLITAGSILQSLGMTDNQLITLSALAKLYTRSGQTDKAEKTAKQLLVLAERYHSKLFLRDAHKIMSDVARSRNQSALALEHYEQYKRWNDSVFNENKEKSIANTETRLRISQKARENELLKQSNERLEKSNFVIMLTAGVILVAGIFLILAYRAVDKKNTVLKTQKSIIESQSVEKDTLLKEIHHRVKNNLQIVSGLLNLQAGTVTDEKARDALMVSQKRIKAISLIHQNLYGFDQLTSIPLAEYIRQLYNDLRLLSNSANIEMHCVTDPEHIILDVETAVPLGLILNECLTNALKYAFAGRADGVIDVSCVLHADQTYTLRISDNGIGLPLNFDPQLSTSLGFRLIRELTRQLRGTFTYASEQGTILHFHFPATAARSLKRG